MAVQELACLPVAAPRPQTDSMPLSMANQGETVIVETIHGGRSLVRRLYDLGLNPGARVQVIKNDSSGPMILAVAGDSRLALGRGMGHQVYVSSAA